MHYRFTLRLIPILHLFNVSWIAFLKGDARQNLYFREARSQDFKKSFKLYKIYTLIYNTSCQTIYLPP